MILFLLLLASAALFALDAFAVIDVAWWVCALPLIPLAIAAVLAFLAALLALIVGAKVAFHATREI